MLGDNEEFERVKRCTALLLDFQSRRNVPEIWIGPFLREMNDVFPSLANAQRKSLLNRVAEIGAIEILTRSRDEEGGTYAAARINWTHPLVIEVNPG